MRTKKISIYLMKCRILLAIAKLDYDKSRINFIDIIHFIRRYLVKNVLGTSIYNVNTYTSFTMKFIS